VRYLANSTVRYPHRILEILLTIAMLAAAAACDRQHAGTAVSGAPGADAQTDAGNPHDIAGRLIKRTVADQENGHVAVEIDHELLRELTAASGRDTGIDAFRDPLLAAWLFAPHTGVPADAVISIEQVSPQAEEASGLFIAVASADTGAGSIKMRLVSEPDAEGRPTLWVLNDYDR